MRRVIALAAVLAAAVAAGCGTAADSTKDFSGTEEDVAQVVEDLEKAATDDAPRRVCTTLLSQAAVRRLGADCSRKVEQAFDRADTFALNVEDVAVAGTTARARVATGRDEDQTEILGLVREQSGWRLNAFPGG